jgi:heat shock protein HtpX
MRGGVQLSSGSSRSSGKDGDKGGNPLGIIVLVLWLLTLIIAPIVSRLLAMAVSRKREYLADASGAQLTRNPGALASALEKLSAAAEPTHMITRGAAHLCIVDPTGSALGDLEGFLPDVFASHPPIAQRVIRLKGMAYQDAKRAGAQTQTA